MPKLPQRILYTARAIATGGRIGTARSDDGVLQVVLGTPLELGGSGHCTNPEQLIAAGYAAAFVAAIKSVAAAGGRRQTVVLPRDVAVECDVGIGPLGDGLVVQVDMRISIPGLKRAVAEMLVDAARQVCPYSQALRDNIQATFTIA